MVMGKPLLTLPDATSASHDHVRRRSLLQQIWMRKERGWEEMGRGEEWFSCKTDGWDRVKWGNEREEKR